MKKNPLIHLAGLTGALTLWAGAAFAKDRPFYTGDDAILAGDQNTTRISLFKYGTDWNRPENVLWSWTPADSPEIKPEDYGSFHHLAEAKRVNHGSCILAAASSGGIALIRLADKRALFYARPGGNTHSVELLPDKNIVSASSTGGYLRLFCTDPAVSRFPDQVKSVDYPFPDAHGVVWDAKRQRLWACGGKVLQSYAYHSDRRHPALTLEETFPYPDGGAHDLFPYPGKDVLITTSKHNWLFDLAAKKFEPFPGLETVGPAKSISVRSDGLVIYQLPKEQWWSDTIPVMGGEAAGTLANARFYKARWWVPNEFSYGPEK